MAFFLHHVPRITWTVYLLEGRDADDALDKYRDEYLGYIDDDDTQEDDKLFGPFATKEEALASDKAWTEGQ